MAKLQTVLGKIDPSEMGVTLAHEHLSADLRFFYVDPPKGCPAGIENAPMTLENMGYIKNYPFSHKANLNMNDSDGQAAVLDSLLHLKANGGRSVVEQSSMGFSRKASHLKRYSQKSGVHIVAGTGYYLEESLSNDILTNATVESIANFCTGEILDGCIDDTTVKAGLIGEVGVSDEIKPIERKSVQATAAAQQVTGAAVSFHPAAHEKSPFDMMRIFLEAGGKKEKTVMCHLEWCFLECMSHENNQDLLYEFAKYNTYLQFDLFGIQNYLPPFDFPSDAQRITLMQSLLDELKCPERVMISSDIYSKHGLEMYGGHGYKYVVKYVSQHMKDKGITQDDLNKFLIENPANFFPF